MGDEPVFAIDGVSQRMMKSLGKALIFFYINMSIGGENFLTDWLVTIPD